MKYQMQVIQVVRSFTTVVLEAESIGEAKDKLKAQAWKYHFDADEPVYDVTHISPIN